MIYSVQEYNEYVAFFSQIFSIFPENVIDYQIDELENADQEHCY